MTRKLLGSLLPLSAVSPAQALCSGETLRVEFRQADIVVRARMISEINARDVPGQ